MSFSVSIKLAESESRKAFRQLWGRDLLYWFTAFSASCVAFIFLERFLSGNFGIITLVLGIILSITGALTLYAYALGIKRIKEQHERLGNTSVTYGFDNFGFSIHSEFGNATWRWDTLYQLSIDSNFLWIFLRKNSYEIIPLHLLTGPAVEFVKSKFSENQRPVSEAGNRRSWLAGDLSRLKSIKCDLNLAKRVVYGLTSVSQLGFALLALFLLAGASAFTISLTRSETGSGIGISSTLELAGYFLLIITPALFLLYITVRQTALQETPGSAQFIFAATALLLAARLIFDWMNESQSFDFIHVFLGLTLSGLIHDGVTCHLRSRKKETAPST